MIKNFVAYYRVSTGKQGTSGLGLEAQRQSVHRFIGLNNIRGEFTDVETGKSDCRPELQKAIVLVQSMDNCSLVISKLDRLSRNLSFISLLMDAKVKFVCVDMPDANELTIHIFAALAQWERKRISERTKEALAQLKERGVKLGCPANFTREVREMGPKKIKEMSALNENNIKAKRIISLLRNQQMSLSRIASDLNNSGFKTSTGKRFTAGQVRRLLA